MLQNASQVPSVVVVGIAFGDQLTELLIVNKPLTKGYLLGDGDLDGLSASALLAAFGPTGLDPLPSMMSSLVPEASAAWSSRAALAGSHDGHLSAASFTTSRSQLISETPVLPGLTEVGADTVIVEA